MPEPAWLRWSREVQAIAQTGLAYARDPHDAGRYEALRALAAEVVAEHAGLPADRVEALFDDQEGYATPKLAVRGAVFDAGGRILMVREAGDGGWTLPGGWADVNETPAECVAKEVREEAGVEVRATKLAAALDRTRQGHPPRAFSCTQLLFLCEPLGGDPRPDGVETTEAAWFARAQVPTALSLSRILPHQIERMFAHAADPTLPTDFD